MASEVKRKAAPDGDDTGSGRRNMHNSIVTESRGEINGKSEDSAGIYEIRRAGAVICFGHIPNLGYPLAVLKDMARNGMHLYYNRKRVKL